MRKNERQHDEHVVEYDHYRFLNSDECSELVKSAMRRFWKRLNEIREAERNGGE